MAAIFQVEVFWFVTPFRFTEVACISRGSALEIHVIESYLHVQSEVKVERKGIFTFTILSHKIKITVKDIRFLRCSRFKSKSSWNMMPCNVVLGYQLFKSPCCLTNEPLKRCYPTISLHGVTTQKMEVAWTSETLVSYHITT
jgi:hypothetical protein